MNDLNNVGYELDWNSEIEKDGADFIVLPAGEYNFTVKAFERGRHTPKEGGKLPACNKAILTIEIDGGEHGNATINHNLFLHSTTEGLLSAFFASIGQKQHGQRVAMNWNNVPMSRGRVKVKIRSYKKDGEDRQINEIEKFLDYNPQMMGAATPATAQPTQQPYQPNPNTQAQQPYQAPQQQYAQQPQQNMQQSPMHQQNLGGFEPGRF